MTKWVMTSRKQGRADGRDPGVAFYIGSVCVAEVIFLAKTPTVLLSIDTDQPDYQRHHPSVSSAMREMHRLLCSPPAAPRN